MNLQKIEQYESHVLWLSKSVDYGDFPLRYFLKLEYMDYYMSEKEVKEFGKYHVTLGAVSVAALSASSKNSLESSLGDITDIDRITDDFKHAECVSIGFYAPFFQQAGNNKNALLRIARKEFKQIQFLFGFYMDKQVNAIGATGWDAIKGELVPRGN